MIIYLLILLGFLFYTLPSERSTESDQVEF